MNIRAESALLRALMGAQNPKGHLKPHKDKAVKIAEEWFKNLSKNEALRIQAKIEYLFLLWARDWEKKAIQRKLKNLKSKADVDKVYDQLASMKPWEHLAARPQTPIDLLEHLWAIGFPDSEVSLKPEEYLNALSWLVIYSDERKNFDFWDSMILASLQLSDFMHTLKKSEAAHYLKQAIKYGEPAFKKAKTLRENNFAKIEKLKPLKQAIHELASSCLKENVEKHLIVNRICQRLKKARKPLSEKQIRRYLRDHPSGMWALKKRTRR